MSLVKEVEDRGSSIVWSPHHKTRQWLALGTKEGAGGGFDKHFSLLSKKHMETKFVKINAEKSPFLCEKLHIWMIPSMVCIKDGKTDHTIAGFEELGGSEEFSTELLEYHLGQYDMLNCDSQRPPSPGGTSSKLTRLNGKNSVKQSTLCDDDDSDDGDW